MAALGRYEEWNREHPVLMTPTAGVAAVASLYRLLPEEAWHREDDAEFRGVRNLLDALARLGGTRE